MEIQKLELNPRERLGKGAARQVRKRADVPVVVYGKDRDTEHYSVNAHDLETALAHHARLLQLNQGKKQLGVCLVREIQRHPVSEDVMHADFYSVQPEDKIQLQLPVRLTGRPVGVKQGGQVRTLLHRVNVECKTADLPMFYEIDITRLEAGSTLLVRDLPLGDIKVLNHEHVAVVQITKPRDKT